MGVVIGLRIVGRIPMFRELTDEAWAVLAPLLPPPARTGRPRTDDGGVMICLARVFR